MTTLISGFASTGVVDFIRLGKLWEEIKKFFHTQTLTMVRVKIKT